MMHLLPCPIARISFGEAFYNDSLIVYRARWTTPKRARSTDISSLRSTNPFRIMTSGGNVRSLLTQLRETGPVPVCRIGKQSGEYDQPSFVRSVGDEYDKWVWTGKLTWPDYTADLWNEVDQTIQLRDCIVYTYISDLSDDPLSEGQM